MKLLTWNLRGGSSAAHDHLGTLGFDIGFVQEAKLARLPARTVWAGPTRRKSGSPQSWGSALVPAPDVTVRPLGLESLAPHWASRWLATIGGAVVAGELTSKHGEVVLLSCYSPAWKIQLPTAPPTAEQVASVRLRAKKDAEVWAADLIWVLLDELCRTGRDVIAAGDFNLCVAFDETIGSGNREYVDRMSSSGLSEVVRHFYPDERATPTFRNARSKRIEHQLDYVWVTPGLKSRLLTCALGEHQLLLDNTSDHLPVLFEVDL